MKNTCVNAYLFQAWLDLINDSHLDPFIIIDPTRTERKISVPMDYCIDGLLTLNVAVRTLGHFNLDKTSGYLMMSTRFNRMEQHMEIPVESIVLIKSSCNKLLFELPKGLQLTGDYKKEDKVVEKAPVSSLTVIGGKASAKGKIMKKSRLTVIQ
ncbi:hypothetical protein KAU11_11000 [Candidatus Babeliales bacterium]|nr:hypothetical protein [Candidatus Babeliales bacterium]